MIHCDHFRLLGHRKPRTKSGQRDQAHVSGPALPAGQTDAEQMVSGRYSLTTDAPTLRVRRLGSFPVITAILVNASANMHVRATTDTLPLRADRSVVLRAAVALDLGGIAEGFAVDKAVEALRAGGAIAGLVNAGGDMRIFGSRPEPVWTRWTHVGVGVAGSLLVPRHIWLGRRRNSKLAGRTAEPAARANVRRLTA